MRTKSTYRNLQPIGRLDTGATGPMGASWCIRYRHTDHHTVHGEKSPYGTIHGRIRRWTVPFSGDHDPCVRNPHTGTYSPLATSIQVLQGQWVHPGASGTDTLTIIPSTARKRTKKKIDKKMYYYTPKRQYLVFITPFLHPIEKLHKHKTLNYKILRKNNNTHSGYNF